MIDPELIVALLAGELDGAEADAVEEHLLGCDACSAHAAWLAALRDGVRVLARAGRIDLVDPGAVVARIAGDGLPVRRYRLRPGEVVPCSIGDEVFNLVELAVDAAGAARIDVELRGPGGVLLARHDDVPFDPTAGIVHLVARGDQIRALPSIRLTVRLLDGERLLGEYVLDHRATAG